MTIKRGPTARKESQSVDRFNDKAPDAHRKGVTPGGKEQSTLTIAPDLLAKVGEIASKMGQGRGALVNRAIHGTGRAGCPMNQTDAPGDYDADILVAVRGPGRAAPSGRRRPDERQRWETPARDRSQVIILSNLKNPRRRHIISNRPVDAITIEVATPSRINSFSERARRMSIKLWVSNIWATDNTDVSSNQSRSIRKGIFDNSSARISLRSKKQKK